MCRKCAYFGEYRFGVDLGRVLEWFSEAQILDFHGFWAFFSIKIDIKLKLRKIAKKAGNLEPGPWLPGGRPLGQNPQDGVLAPFY